MNLRLQNLLSQGESRKVEFKAARQALNRNLYETICAFLNRDGGGLSYNRFGGLLADLSKAVKLNHVLTCHGARRGAITELYQRGASPGDLAEAAGNTVPVLMRSYVHGTGQRAIEAMKKWGDAN